MSDKKTDRICNNPKCRKRLTERAPNWFQCSEACRAIVFRLNHPNYDESHRREDEAIAYEMGRFLGGDF